MELPTIWLGVANRSWKQLHIAHMGSTSFPVKDLRLEGLMGPLLHLLKWFFEDNNFLHSHFFSLSWKYYYTATMKLYNGSFPTDHSISWTSMVQTLLQADHIGNSWSFAYDGNNILNHLNVGFSCIVTRMRELFSYIDY